jgi:hypothetical protein
MDRMGHGSTTRAALIYLHTSDERQRKLADAVGQAARAALSGAQQNRDRIWHGSASKSRSDAVKPSAPGRIRTRDPAA